MKNTKKPKNKIENWFKDLFIGYHVGILDLFFGSWKRVVAFVLLLLLPIIYGTVTSLAYWNPGENLNRVPLAILDNDYNFVEVIQTKENPDGKTYQYNIGALMNPENEDEIFGSNSNDNINKYVNTIEEGTPLVLNTRDNQNQKLKINYNSNDTILLPTKTWDLYKSVMQKKSDQVDDNGARFALTIAPSNNLKFNDITYFNDQKKIDNIWKTNKYQGQMKIDKGYGANIVKNLGQVFLSDGQLIKQEDSDPKLNIFTTFQRSFLIGYMFQTFSSFKDLIIEKMMPLVNAIYDNDVAMKLFGTSGQELTSMEDIDPNGSYLVKDATSTKLPPNSTLFGDKTGANGKIYKWLSAVLKINSTQSDNVDNKLNMLYPDTFNFYNFLDELLSTGMANLAPSTVSTSDSKNYDDLAKYGTLALQDIMTKDQKTFEIIEPNKQSYGESLINAYKKLMYYRGPEIKTMPLFENDSAIVSQSSDWNINKYFAKIMISNVSNGDPFFVKQLPAPLPGLLGVAYKNVQTKVNLKGWNPQMDKTLDTNSINGKGYVTVYGVGLGGMFVIIGLFIATTMSRSIVSRNKQYANLNWASYYISKFLIFITIGFFQSTLTIWIVYAASWHRVMSPGVAALDWLWIMNADIIIISVLFGFQYLFGSQLIGGILGIIYLMFNITSGGGSYPALLEYGFFRGIQYIVPFRYIFMGLDEINFGVNIVGANHSSTIFMFQQWGILIAFFAVFFLAGFIASYWRIRDVTYGTHHGKYVYYVLNQQKNQLSEKFRTIKKETKKGKTKYTYHWNVLWKRPDPHFIYEIGQLKHKKDFKWYTKVRSDLQKYEDITKSSDDY